MTTTHAEHDIAILYCSVYSADGGQIIVHKAGCRDIDRDRRRFHASVEPTIVRDIHDIVLDIYGPNSGSYFAEQGLTIEDWAEYFVDIDIKPCVKGLPYDIAEITTDDRAARYGDDRED
jgi:hypothetical protein